MERQTILERLGWRFIRIRGSEYYRAPEKTINRVIGELAAFGIEPETAVETENDMARTSELLRRVKLRAAQIMEKGSNGDFIDVTSTVRAALDPKSMVQRNAVPNAAKSLVGEKARPSAPTVQKQKLAANSQNSTKKSSVQTKRKDAPNEEPKFLSKPEQQMLPGFETPLDDILKLLKKHHVRYIDKRTSGGALWIIGGHELDSLVIEAKKVGFDFRYKPNGSKATENQAGWWAK